MIECCRPHSPSAFAVDFKALVAGVSVFAGLRGLVVYATLRSAGTPERGVMSGMWVRLSPNGFRPATRAVLQGF